MVIDLAARLVVVDSIYSSPGPVGDVRYDDGQNQTKVRLRYHLAGDWLFTRDGEQWHAVAQSRRAQRVAEPPLDARRVFYGRPLLEHIAREVFVASAEYDAVAHEERTQWTEETIRGIHAAWLLTPRPDLGGVSPREVALTQHDHLTWDLQDRCDQWSLLGECPCGLDESSFAFRYGGFGTHELVEYYELVRTLLWSSWDQLLPESPKSLASGSRERSVETFVEQEVARLETVRDEWLDSPDPECQNRTPRSIIERERARIPEAVSGREAMVDPDCPCCQMMAEDSGPFFWHLDGCNMDDDFAFDISSRTREEWEERERERDRISRQVLAEMEERRRLGVSGSTASGGEDSSPWTASFCVDDTADVPLGARLFGLGCRLAELIAQLRDGADRSTTPPETQQLIDELNRHFGNLREILGQPGPELAAALFEPVINCFGEALARVATTRADLAAKCESLAGSLATLLDEPPPEPA